MAFTGQDISTTASSWAWALGLAGAMATAGAVIASSTAAAAAIAVAVVKRPIAAVLHAAAEQRATAGQCAAAERRAMAERLVQAAQGPTQGMPQPHAPAPRTRPTQQLPAHQRLTQQHLTHPLPGAVVAAQHTAVVVVEHTAAANTSNLTSPNNATASTTCGGAYQLRRFALRGTIHRCIPAEERNAVSRPASMRSNPLVRRTRRAGRVTPLLQRGGHLG